MDAAAVHETWRQDIESRSPGPQAGAVECLGISSINDAKRFLCNLGNWTACVTHALLLLRRGNSGLCGDVLGKRRCSFPLV